MEHLGMEQLTDVTDAMGEPDSSGPSIQLGVQPLADADAADE